MKQAFAKAPKIADILGPATGFDVPGRWAVARIRTPQLQFALLNLERQGFGIYHPQLAVSKLKGVEIRPLFPGYVFVRIDPDTPHWRKIRRTYGVKDVFSARERPLFVEDALLIRLRQAEVARAERFRHDDPEAPLPCPFSQGDRVKVVGGQFAAFDAVFEERVDSRRVAVLMSALGRSTRIEMDLQHLDLSEAKCGKRSTPTQDQDGDEDAADAA